MKFSFGFSPKALSPTFVGDRPLSPTRKPTLNRHFFHRHANRHWNRPTLEQKLSSWTIAQWLTQRNAQQRVVGSNLVVSFLINYQMSQRPPDVQFSWPKLQRLISDSPGRWFSSEIGRICIQKAQAFTPKNKMRPNWTLQIFWAVASIVASTKYGRHQKQLRRPPHTNESTMQSRQMTNAMTTETNIRAQPFDPSEF